jgi:hypothetical protein
METFNCENLYPDEDLKYEAEMLNPYVVKLSSLDDLVKWVHA